MTYSQLLLEPEWIAKKKSILKRDNYQCQHCTQYDTEMHVHHMYYIDDAAPWEYPDDALITLCANCHKTEEEEKKLAAERCAYAAAHGVLYMDMDFFFRMLVKRLDRMPSMTDKQNFVFKVIQFIQ